MKPIKILLIDNVENCRIFVKELLQDIDLKVEIEEAASSAEGLKKLQTKPFDCVLTEYLIPRDSGLEVMKMARSSGNKTPFIIMTADIDTGLKFALKKQGVASVISKNEMSAGNLQYEINAAVSVLQNEVVEVVTAKINAGSIKDYMHSPPLSVESSLTIKQVVDSINAHGVSSFLVKENNRYVGIVTKKDLIRKVIANKMCRDTTKVSQVMTLDPFTMPAETSIADAIEFMKSKGIRHLPVTENGEVTGVVSVKDLYSES